MNNELIGVISSEGELKGVIEDNSFNVIVQITETGPRGPQGPPGIDGKSLEFHWDGTKLGVRVEGETDYQHVDLKGPQGERGPQGPKGDAGPPGTTYIHHQQVAAKTWRVEHDLGGYPGVTIVDSSGRYVIGDVQFLDENTIEISFSASFTGKAYLN